MAFSYSDKNFTVIGNLCFVHILLDGTKTLFDIPSAIADRMLFNNIILNYTYYTTISSGGHSELKINTGVAQIKFGKILCNGEGDGYLYCYFPIDSNK